MKNYPEFKNVSVIVTGVASGIGRAQAEKFLLEGAFVFGGDINDNEAVKNLKRRFPQTFRSATSPNLNKSGSLLMRLCIF